MGCVWLYLQSEGGLRTQSEAGARNTEKDGGITYARAALCIQSQQHLEVDKTNRSQRRARRDFSIIALKEIRNAGF